MKLKCTTCDNCNTTIISLHRHDFNTCKCGNVSIDGGLDYVRRISNKPKDLEEKEVYDLIKIIRNRFRWTSVLDKKGNRLKTPKSKLLKNLDTEHIIDIQRYCLDKFLKNGELNMSKEWVLTFHILLSELKYRNNEKTKKIKV